MDMFPPALPHGALEEIFPDVFLVTGAMKTVLMDTNWQFDRNMTVVREGDALTLINTVRLDEAGLADLERLGQVRNVVRIGALHGRDDAFYKARYGASFWTLPGLPHEHGLQPDRELIQGGEMPFAGCSLFDFRTTKLPECILHVDRAGGILIACDALQNWLQPSEHFSPESGAMMTDMGFFQPANFGPLWMQVSAPQAADFERLNELSYRHALCGHGAPLRDTAREDYAARARAVFGIA
jgi:hypothetical protein